MFIRPNTHLYAQLYYINVAYISKVIYAVLTELSEKQKPYFCFLPLYFVYRHTDIKAYGGGL
jgi:hypothetical protein